MTSLTLEIPLLLNGIRRASYSVKGNKSSITACSKDVTVMFRVVFLSLSKRMIMYPTMTPLDSFKLGGFQASVTLVAEVAAGVMFCGIPSGTVGNKMTSQSED